MKLASILAYLSALYFVAAKTDEELEAFLRKWDSLQKRVIGGNEIEEGEFPWLVSIQAKVSTGWFWKKQQRKYFCGASLLNDRWLLTAAHCFRPKNGPSLENVKYWHARLGDTELDHKLFDRIKNKIAHFFGSAFGIKHLRDYYLHFEKIIVHPHYDANNFWANDIALVKMKETVASNGNDVKKIQSIPLPRHGDSSFPADNSQCSMSGWGCTQGGSHVSEDANHVILPKISDKHCAQLWRVDTSIRLCAGYNLQQKGICPGDSGGALVCKDKNGRWVQAGIASFTSYKRPGKVPGAFTRVSHYVKWINQVISN